MYTVFVWWQSNLSAFIDSTVGAGPHSAQQWRISSIVWVLPVRAAPLAGAPARAASRRALARRAPPPARAPRPPARPTPAPPPPPPPRARCCCSTIDPCLRWGDNPHYRLRQPCSDQTKQYYNVIKTYVKYIDLGMYLVCWDVHGHVTYFCPLSVRKRAEWVASTTPSCKDKKSSTVSVNVWTVVMY